MNPAVPVSASGQGKGIVSIACPADRIVGNDPGLCSAVVDIGTPTVEADGCPVTIASVRSDGLLLVNPYPVGTTLVDWTAKDGGNNAMACTQSVTVNDVEPPVIAGLGADPISLWPPNHKMTTVAISYTVTDNCDALPAISCGLAAASNEPVNGTGDGDTSPDWEILGAEEPAAPRGAGGPRLGPDLHHDRHLHGHQEQRVECRDSRHGSTRPALTRRPVLPGRGASRGAATACASTS